MQLILCATLAVASVALASEAPRLVPRIILPEEPIEGSFWLGADNIAVVKVRNANWVGPEIEVTPPQRLVVRLVHATAELEQVIKGSLLAGPTEFYFFTNTLSEHGYTTVRYWLEPGNRYVVFLRQDGPVLRTMADVGEPELRVRTGKANSALGLPADIGTALASVLLTPGPDYETGFARNVGHTHDMIESWVPPARLVGVLRELLAHRDPEIREQACLVLSRRYPYRDACLIGLLKSINGLVRVQAEDLFSIQQKNAGRLLQTLEDDPVSLTISGKVASLADDLRLFTLDRDPQVRALACSAIQRLLPFAEVSDCPVEGNTRGKARQPE